MTFRWLVIQTNGLSTTGAAAVDSASEAREVVDDRVKRISESDHEAPVLLTTITASDGSMSRTDFHAAPDDGHTIRLPKHMTLAGLAEPLYGGW